MSARLTGLTAEMAAAGLVAAARLNGVDPLKVFAAAAVKGAPRARFCFASAVMASAPQQGLVTVLARVLGMKSPQQLAPSMLARCAITAEEQLTVVEAMKAAGFDPAKVVVTDADLRVAVDPELLALFKADYLRPQRPSAAACYARLTTVAAQRGLALPSLQTLARRLDADTPRAEQERLRQAQPTPPVPAPTPTIKVNGGGNRFDPAVLKDGPRRRPVPTEQRDRGRQTDVQLRSDDTAVAMFGRDAQLVEACVRAGGFPVAVKAGPGRVRWVGGPARAGGRR